MTAVSEYELAVLNIFIFNMFVFSMFESILFRLLVLQVPGSHSRTHARGLKSPNSYELCHGLSEYSIVIGWQVLIQFVELHR